ncbi:hypothetical protein [Actinoplanes sp. RD1]|uniref:hypothetical protein n=1 Tax=Actinoplanes sp. RD1 TaxID=3064538 RepID=UPI002740E6C6|nr:hypothetical protein [Actinoplanes sp. RD1]
MSVFRASNAKPTSRAPAEFPDGPTERLGSPEIPPAQPRAGVAAAILLAMLALIVATAALLLAWRAQDRSGHETPATAAWAMEGWHGAPDRMMVAPREHLCEEIFP